jgi:hypothetical protein
MERGDTNRAIPAERNRFMAGQNERPHPAVGDRIEEGRNPGEKGRPGLGPDKMLGIGSMEPIAADPNQRGGIGPTSASADIRAKLGEHPAQAAEIRRVADRR